MWSVPSSSSATACTSVYESTRTRVSMAVTPASGPSAKVAATGAGLRSITSVTAFTYRGSPGARLSRRVTGTMAASSARAGMSMAMTPVPSANARPSNTSRTRSGHGLGGSGAAARAAPAASAPAMHSIRTAVVFMRSFPFQLGERGGGVARIILLEQAPVRLFRGGGAFRRADGGAASDQAPHVLGQALKIAPLRRERIRPRGNRAMAGDHALRRQARQRIEHAQPAAQAAVKDRNVVEEHEVARQQGLRLLVEHREVGVGMGGRPRMENQPAPAEVENILAVDQPGGRDDFYPGHQVVAEDAAEIAQVERAARRQAAWQVLVADEDGVAREGGIAEHVVGMGVRVDDVAHRLRGHAADGGGELATLGHAAAGVDHGDRRVADDEADIGDGAGIGGRHHGGGALVDEHAGRDLGHRQRIGRRLRLAQGRGACQRDRTRKVSVRTAGHPGMLHGWTGQEDRNSWYTARGPWCWPWRRCWRWCRWCR